ncbi:hypothetical protein AWM70_17225 [Paenibacillus yonginensis]|uniref:SLH domain-containing protein n=1 Tax=Paenibacillus yonginensis TaxID=1462996 RepID=A0A1B1N3T5_9BACL|nr:SwmB domain-containing protein [Paenibacillus yonginensis]ANS76108.1 hypothetical protein AWM70_17225 [Paenibacillus yonginensis]
MKWIKKMTGLLLTLALVFSGFTGLRPVSAADAVPLPIGSLVPPTLPAPEATIDLAQSGDTITLTATFTSSVAVNPDNVNRSAHLIDADAPQRNLASWDIKSLTQDSSGNPQLSFLVNREWLGPGKTYYVTIDDDAFVDANDPTVIYDGFQDDQTWRFQTKQASPAIVSRLTPTGTNVQPPTQLTIQFSKPIIGKKSGTIAVQGQGVAKQNIDISSNAVAVNGTNTVVISLPQNLRYNTSYTVSVPAGAFEDNDHVLTPAIANSDWTFTTASSTSSQLVISSLSPSNGSSNVSPGTSVLTATFNSNIKAAAGTTFSLGTASGVLLYKYGSSTPLSGTAAVSGKNLVITPASALTEGSSYYIIISGTAIMDAVTNAYFGGLTSTSGWYFTTATLDKTPPVIQKAQVYSNNTIRLQYNESLSSVSLPANIYSVTVNGETRSISSAYAAGDSVYVTLQVGVAVGQNIRISYSPSSSYLRVADLSQNAAASFSNMEVENGLETSMPKPKDGYISGNTVVLHFADSLQSVSSYAYSQFTVTQDGSSTSVAGISQSGSTVTLTLSSSAIANAVVKVNYTPGSYPLKDYRGLEIPTFSDFFVRNYNDNRPPQFQGVVGSNNKIILTYDEGLSTTNVPLKSQYSILVNNSPVYVTAIGIKDNQVTLTLASSFNASQSVTLSYVSAAGGISDWSNNLAGYLNLVPVQYGNVTAGIGSATVNGDTMKIQFNNSLSTASSSSGISIGYFAVTVDNQNRSLMSASLSGNTLTIMLGSPVNAGQTVTFSYIPGSSGVLRDSQGNSLNAISQAAVQNTTGSVNNGGTTGSAIAPNLSILSSSEFNQSGYVLDRAAATAATAYSRGGQTVNKYTIDAAKLTDAYNYIASNAAANARVMVFEVPSSNKAAYVGAPLKPLMDAFTRSSEAEFGIKYGDVLYLLPLKQLPFSSLAMSLGAGFNSANVWFQIEQVSKDNLNIINSSNGVTTLPLLDPTEVFISAATGASADLSYMNVSGDLFIKTGGSVSASNTAMYAYDRSTQKVLFVPTKISSSGAYTVLTTTLKSGSSLVGPRSGYANLTDIQNHWANTTISELVSKSVMDPAASGLFKPKQNITRAEFATYIAKGLGLSPDKASAAAFGDVSPSSEAAGYIGAAAKAGIVAGVSSTAFKPGSYITREQMTLMMARAMSSAGQPLNASVNPDGVLSKFKDNKQISAASKAVVAQAVNAGVIQGTSTGTFNPKGTATRAEAAVMLKRVLDKLRFLK